MTNNELMQRYASWGFPQKNIEIPKTIRINTLRTDKQTCLKELKRIGVELEKTSLDYAYEVKGGPTLASTLPYLNGWIHIQELSSQLPVYVLDPKPGTKALDVAAAPGNKTTQFAQHMENTGIVVACDAVHERLEKLKSNCARLGATNVVAYQIDATFADELIKDADFVSCDVPCSGNFTQENWNRTMQDIFSRTELQKTLLTTSVYATKIKGSILYSTCSLEIEENEHIVEWALQELPVKLKKIDLKLGHPGLTEKTKLCKRIWPTQDKMGGFFMALLERIE